MLNVRKIRWFVFQTNVLHWWFLRLGRKIAVFQDVSVTKTDTLAIKIGTLSNYDPEWQSADPHDEQLEQITAFLVYIRIEQSPKTTIFVLSFDSRIALEGKRASSVLSSVRGWVTVRP